MTHFLVILISIALSVLVACDSEPVDGDESIETEKVEQDTVAEEQARSDERGEATAHRPIALSIELDEDQLRVAEEWADALVGPTFPSRDVRTENAPLFLHLAASSEDSAVVSASLGALERLYRPEETVGFRHQRPPERAGRASPRLVRRERGCPILITPLPPDADLVHQHEGGPRRL